MSSATCYSSRAQHINHNFSMTKLFGFFNSHRTTELTDSCAVTVCIWLRFDSVDVCLDIPSQTSIAVQAAATLGGSQLKLSFSSHHVIIGGLAQGEENAFKDRELVLVIVMFQGSKKV